MLFFLVWCNKRASRLALWVLFFLLGSLFVARLPQGQPYNGSIVADVQMRVCGGFLVYSNRGRLVLQFYGEPPREGERIAARVVKTAEPLQFSGGVNHTQCLQRARASRVKVKQWISMSNAQERMEYKDARFRFVEHGGLLWSLMSGERSFIQPETKKLLQRTGTAHFLAISGMHIGLVSLLVFGVLRSVCVIFLIFNMNIFFRLFPYVGSIASAYWYASSVGWPTSAQRSVIMIFFVTLAMLLGRKVHVWTILALTAFLVLYREPAQWDTLGFRLSFSAVAGIVWISPRIIRLIPLDAHPLIHKMGNSFAVSFGASIGTLPWMGWYFQGFPIVGWISNVFVAPFLGLIAVPCALLSSLHQGMVGDILLAIGSSSISCASIILKHLDVEPLNIAINDWEVLLLIGILCIPKRDILRLLLTILVLLRPQFPVLNTEIVFLSVGQGDATVIYWSSGEIWLIDTGPKNPQLLQYFRRHRIQRIDRVFLSHSHQDHIGGLYHLLGGLEVGEVWMVRPPNREETSFLTLYTMIKNAKIAIRYPTDIPPKNVHIVHPLQDWKSVARDPVNEESLVLDIDVVGYRLLFTGDIGFEAERYLLQQEMLSSEYDLVKVAHHGSRYSSSNEFIKKVKADDIVISCGANNRFDHPSESVLFRWRNSRIWRTDVHGSIHIRPISNDFWTEEFAKP